MKTDPSSHVVTLAVISDETVARGASTAAKDQLLAELLGFSEQPPAIPVKHSWWRRPVVVLSSFGALASSTAFAVVALQGPASRDLTSTECRYVDGDVIVAATSGDPVADCEAQWRRDHRSAAPQLIAYAKRGLAVLVLTPGEPVPPGFIRLPGGTAQNTALIELDESEGDMVSGLSSGCFSKTSATDRTQAELTRLGLTDWRIQTRGPAADGTSTCEAYVSLDPVTRTVLLGSGPDPAPQAGSGSATLAADLRRIDGECSDLGTTAARVLAAAAARGWTEANQGLDLALVTVPGAACTRIYYEAGGAALITLRGPAEVPRNGSAG